jgi:hypothetical protein
VNDINTNSPFNPLLYAENILSDFRSFLIKLWDQTVKKLPEHENATYLSEELVIEHTLKYCFKDQLKHFPYITVNSLKELMVY